MRSQSATPTYALATAAALALEAAFDGGHLTSDGGLPWLAEAEAATGICATLACVGRKVQPPAQHPARRRPGRSYAPVSTTVAVRASDSLSDWRGAR